MTTACANITEFQARTTCFLERNPVESAIRNALKLDGWINYCLLSKKPNPMSEAALVSSIRKGPVKNFIWIKLYSASQAVEISYTFLDRNVVSKPYKSVFVLSCPAGKFGKNPDSAIPQSVLWGFPQRCRSRAADSILALTQRNIWAQKRLENYRKADGNHGLKWLRCLRGRY